LKLPLILWNVAGMHERQKKIRILPEAITQQMVIDKAFFNPIFV
jgi:hypothetical protein